MAYGTKEKSSFQLVVTLTVSVAACCFSNGWQACVMCVMYNVHVQVHTCVCACVFISFLSYPLMPANFLIYDKIKPYNYELSSVIYD